MWQKWRPSLNSGLGIWYLCLLQWSFFGLSLKSRARISCWKLNWQKKGASCPCLMLFACWISALGGGGAEKKPVEARSAHLQLPEHLDTGKQYQQNATTQLAQPTCCPGLPVVHSCKSPPARQKCPNRDMVAARVHGHLTLLYLSFWSSRRKCCRTGLPPWLFPLPSGQPLRTAKECWWESFFYKDTAPLQTSRQHLIVPGCAHGAKGDVEHLYPFS